MLCSEANNPMAWMPYLIVKNSTMTIQNSKKCYLEKVRLNMFNRSAGNGRIIISRLEQAFLTFPIEIQFPVD